MKHLSRRALLNAGCTTTALIGASAIAAAAAGTKALAQCPPPDNDPYYFRDDWFGEPWRNPETAVLIHGNDESSIVWYAWMPSMAREFRVLRPDLPGFGRSKVPPGFQWSMPGLAGFVARVLDKAGVDRAHIVGAKTGGAIAMQFAADYPDRTRTLSVVSGPASVVQIVNPSPIPQRDRLGSHAPKEMVDYWNTMFANAPVEGKKGLDGVLAKFDLARDGVLQRIRSPALIVTSDRSALQSVEKVRQYQRLIANSRLVVLDSDAYHIAAANPDECLANVLAFIRETQQKT